MVAGDAVIVYGLDNTQILFTPAAGVEVLISCVFRQGTGSSIGLNDGASNSYVSPAATDMGTTNMKTFVNNTYSYRVGNGGAGTFMSITGIQIK